MDEWKWSSSTNDVTPEVAEAIDEVIGTLHAMVLDLPGMKSSDLVDTCKNLRLPVSMGIREVEPDVRWPDERLTDLREEVAKWRNEVLASGIEPIRKRNIIKALDELTEAIDSYPSKGANNLTDVMVRTYAVINLLAPHLVKAGELAEKVTKMLPGSD